MQYLKSLEEQVNHLEKYPRCVNNWTICACFFFILSSSQNGKSFVVWMMTNWPHSDRELVSFVRSCTQTKKWVWCWQYSFTLCFFYQTETILNGSIPHCNVASDRTNTSHSSHLPSPGLSPASGRKNELLIRADSRRAASMREQLFAKVRTLMNLHNGITCIEVCVCTCKFCHKIL